MERTYSEALHHAAAIRRDSSGLMRLTLGPTAALLAWLYDRDSCEVLQELQQLTGDQDTLTILAAAGELPELDFDDNLWGDVDGL